MKSYRKELWFNVPGRRAFINITPQVEECLRYQYTDNFNSFIRVPYEPALADVTQTPRTRIFH